MKSIHAETDLQNCQWSHMHSEFWKLQSEKGLVHMPILWRKYPILTVLRVLFDVWCDRGFPTLRLYNYLSRALTDRVSNDRTYFPCMIYNLNDKMIYSKSEVLVFFGEYENVLLTISVSVKARSVPTTLTDCAYSFWCNMYLKSAQFAGVPRLKLFGW